MIQRRNVQLEKQTKEESIHNCQTVSLIAYQGKISGQMLYLGTKDSYGTEYLQVLPGPGWEGLTITATFVTPAGSTRVLVPDGGLLAVPAEAMTTALSHRNPGRIVFTGVADGVQRITADIIYTVSDHVDTEGADSQPTPSVWGQFVGQVQQDANTAAQSATEAANSATEAAGSAAQAGQSAEKADKSAQDAAAELGKVQNVETAALKGIGAAQTAAIDAVLQAQQKSVDALQGAQRTATQEVQQAAATEVEKVDNAGAAQTKAVQDEGTEQDQLVTETGNAQAKRLEALVPDVYTKTESDARYASIEAAIKVSGKGTGLASLSPTIPWKPQGLKLYGRSWQDGAPSPETPVPIQSAGQSGTVDVTVCGSNVLPTDYKSTPPSGVSFNSDGSVTVSSAQETKFTVELYPNNNKLDLPKGWYSFSANSDGGEMRVFQAGVTQTSPLYVSGPIRVVLIVNAGFTGTLYPALFAGKTSQPWQPYKAQQRPIPTPDGLLGIPVDSGGNWVDEAGQERVSDVVDLASGTKEDHIAQVTLNGSEDWKRDDFYFSLKPTGVVKGKVKTIDPPMLSNVGAVSYKVIDNKGYGFAYAYFFRFRSEALNPDVATVEDLKMWLQAHPINVLMARLDPSVSPLDADTIAAYKALQSYPGTTNILAPNCGIEAMAVGDATQVITNINNKIAALESAATGI